MKKAISFSVQIFKITFCVLYLLNTKVMVWAQSNEPPIVSLTHPLENSAYNVGIIRFEATASDPDGSVTNVQFMVNSNLIGAVAQSPYVLWTTNQFHVQGYFAEAVAYDDQGAATTSSAVYFRVLQDPTPFVRVTSPEDNDIFSSLDTVVIEAFFDNTDDGPNPMLFYDGTTKLGIDTNFPYGLIVSNLSVGAHSLYVVATNNFGLVATSAPVNITITDMALINPGFTTNGLFAFTVEGVLPGRTNVIESSSDFADWLPVHTNVSNSTEFVFTDPDAALYSRRFYRAKILE